MHMPDPLPFSELDGNGNGLQSLNLMVKDKRDQSLLCLTYIIVLGINLFQV